jgi:hypothetical protein
MALMSETICWISGSKQSDYLLEYEDCTNDKLHKMKRLRSRGFEDEHICCPKNFEGPKIVNFPL